ncbi:tape measure protein [Microbacterium sp. LMI1x-1-1.1]|uniref:tape measure protein n=1 Tax=Microbacterium sp. LMI1x-1-1.1 TaxID=3135246 RepID=UPI0034339E2E
MAEVASASVGLIPTFAGGPRKIEQAMGPALDRAGVTGGQQYGQSFAGALMASPAIRQLAAAGGIGAILFAGINRVKAIDTAQAKLRGLGNDAERVDKIMQNALASVKGTAFGLDDAVTVASQLVAAQIPAGQQLESTLKSVANAAAASGSTLSEMGSIYAKVASLNKAQNDSLQQVADRGIPIYQALATQLGVTTEEVFKMASAGRIGFAEFSEAMTSASGTVAAEMGETLQGRVDNLLAAVGRLGAGLAGGSLTQGANTLTTLTKAIDGLTPAATVLGNAAGAVVGALNAVPGPVYASVAAFVALRAVTRTTAFQTIAGQARGLGTALTTVTAITRSSGSAMVGLQAGVAAVTPAARAAGASLLTAFGGPVGLAIAGVSLAVGGLITVWQQGEQAAADQKAAIDELTASLDANTGATTKTTVAAITKDLEGVFPILDKLRINYTGLATAISDGDPEGKVAALREELQALAKSDADVDKPIWDAITEGLNGTKTASDALKGVDEVLANLDAALKASEQSMKAVGDEANTGLAPAFENVGDAVESAFSSINGLAGQTSAIRDLAQSFIDNGNAINTTTSGGIANLGALQATIAAMADNAGDNYGVFVSNVGGLMSYLDSQGINTQNVMGAVRAAVENVAGKRYSIFFDGSQFIAESNQVVKAARATIAAATMVTRAGDLTLNRNTPGFNSAVRALRDFDSTVRQAAQAQTYIGSQFRGVKSAAVGSAKAVKSVGSSIKKTSATAAKAAQKTASDLKKVREELYATARAWLTPSSFTSEAVSLMDRIRESFSDKAIGRGTRNRLIERVKQTDQAMQRVVKNRERLADQIDAASEKLADAVALRNDYRSQIIEGVRDLADISKYSAAEDTVNALREQYQALGDIAKYTASEDAVGALRDQYRALGDLSKFAADTADDTLATLRTQYRALGALSKFAEDVEKTVTETYTQGGREYTVQQVVKQKKNADALIQGLSDQVAAAESFQANVKQLQSLGLNKTTLDEMMSDFLSSGDGSVISELVKGGSSAVAEVNALMGRLGAMAGTAETVSDQQATARKKITDGLKDQLTQAKQFKAAYSKLQNLGLNQTSLADLLGDFTSSGDASQIRALAAGGADAVSSVNYLMSQLSNLAGSTRTVSQEQAATRQAMAAGLREQVAQAKSFKSAYAQLERLGLNETSLSNLMTEFMSNGDASQIKALVAGGKASVGEVNRLMNQLGELGGKTQTIAQKQTATRRAVANGLRDQLAQAKSFKSAYDKLRKAGLNDASLQNLMTDFLSTGDSAQAAAIASGGKATVNEINKLMKDIGGVTGDSKSGWANAVATDMFGAGVSAADGFLKGLQSRDKALNKQYASMAATLLATIRKDLGIRSPSRKMEYLANMTSDGWNQNLHLDPVSPDVAVPDPMTRAGLADGSGLVVYVENPWTGEQVHAHTVQVARGEMDAQSSARALTLRGGRRT